MESKIVRERLRGKNNGRFNLVEELNSKISRSNEF
jgi:hypothetical protein